MLLIKRLLNVILILVLLLIASAVGAFFLIDDKTIEENALGALQNTLKREVTVDGHFVLTRSLHPTLQTSGVKIASAVWDQNQHLLTAEKLEIGIALLDLLRGIISIENVKFENTQINLIRNADGQSNLDFDKKESSKKKTSYPVSLDIIDIIIKNLTVNYHDAQRSSNLTFALDSFYLQPKNKTTINVEAESSLNEQAINVTGQLCRIRELLKGNDCKLKTKINAEPFDSDINGTINIASAGYLDLKIKTQAEDISTFKPLEEIPLPSTQSFNAAFSLDGSFQSTRLSNLDSEVELEDSKFALKGGIGSLNNLSGVNLELEASGSKPAWLNQYQQTFPAELVDNYKLKSNIEGNNPSWKIHSIHTQLEIDKSTIDATGSIDLLEQAATFALAINAQGSKPAWLNQLQESIDAAQLDKFSIQAELSNPENLLAINIKQAEFNIDKSITSTSGSIQLNTNNDPQVNLTVTSKGKNLKAFEKLAKQAMPPTKNFEVATKLNYQNNILELADLKVSIEDTKIAGDSEIEFTSPVNIRANLKADSLNIDHIIALTGKDPKENNNSTEAPKENTLFSDKPIELDHLKNANTEVDLDINELIYKKAVLKNIQLNATAKNNNAAIDIKSLSYLDADLRASASVDANTYNFKHSLHTEEFNLGQLLSEIEASNTLQGKIDAAIELNSHGKTSQELANHAQGKITAIMTEGTLADAPIDLLASNLLVELMPGKSKKENTKIECLFVQFSGKEGLFESEATLLNTENIVMTTNGSVNLKDEKLDLLLIPKPKDIELFTLDSNIRVKGNITEPSFSLDKGSLFKKLVESAATVALGPAALAIPFASLGDSKSEKCFSEVASATTKAVEAQQEAERKAKEEAERKAKEEAEKAKLEETKNAVVEELE